MCDPCHTAVEPLPFQPPDMAVRYSTSYLYHPIWRDDKQMLVLVQDACLTPLLFLGQFSL